MMAWAYENNYTRIFATSTDNYDMNAAMITADYYRSLGYNLFVANCGDATVAILESFTANGSNDIRNYASNDPAPTFPEVWAYELKEDGWLEIPIFNEDGLPRVNNKNKHLHHALTCQATGECPTFPVYGY